MSDNDTGRIEASWMLTDAADLMERQSVRATFRLSVEFIEALSILSSHFGIKQKSLFDYLLEDTESLLGLARLKQSNRVASKSRVQKTFVISKKSLLTLEALSKDLAVSRDDLVEHAIKRLLPILLKERRLQKNREDALSKIEEKFGQSFELLDEIEKMVGKQDPIYLFFEGALGSYQNAFSDMESLIEKGRKIARLPLDKFQR
jgi:hypothetical protein